MGFWWGIPFAVHAYVPIYFVSSEPFFLGWGISSWDRPARLGLSISLAVRSPLNEAYVYKPVPDVCRPQDSKSILRLVFYHLFFIIISPDIGQIPELAWGPRFNYVFFFISMQSSISTPFPFCTFKCVQSLICIFYVSEIYTWRFLWSGNIEKAHQF